MRTGAFSSVLISRSDLEGLCDDIYIIHEGKIVLHEEMDNLLNEYGLIKADDSQYTKLDKEYILSVRRTPYGYDCLTDQGRFYKKIIPILSLRMDRWMKRSL